MNSIVLRKYGLRVSLILLVCAGTYVLFFITTRVFALKTIQVIGANIRIHVDETKLVRSMVLLNASEIRASILHDSPYVSDVIVTKKYPDTLIIEIQGRVPVAVAKGSQGTQALVDGDGYILPFPLTGTDDFPVIRIADVPVLGNKLEDGRFLQSLTFLQLYGVRSGIQSITVEDGLSLRAKTNETVILFPQKGDLAPRMSSLQTILSSFRMKGSVPSTIDLRFGKPVIR